MTRKRKKPKTKKPSKSLVGCRGCPDKCGGSVCEPFRGKFRDYDGVRFTADSFDCALPVAMDQYNACGFTCQYCFSQYLMRNPNKKESAGYDWSPGEWPIDEFKRLLTEGPEGKYGVFWKALHNVDQGQGPEGYPCPIQWGALGEPFGRIERHRGWGQEAMQMAIEHEQPIRISTKGGRLLQEPEYLDLFAKRPDLFWVAFSLISPDDKALGKVDRNAPTASERLEAMNKLTDLGVDCSLRFRPALPGISDSTKDYPHAWRTLLRKAADAGARAVSFEVVFVPGVRTNDVKAMWNRIESSCGLDLREWYKKTTSKYGACLRSSRKWKEEITYAIMEESHNLGMDFAISDPHWKELNDHGCCCGIPPDHPVFGSWQRANATNKLVEARRQHERGEQVRLVGAKTGVGVPEWSDEVNIREIVCITGPSGAYRSKHATWGTKLRETWNDLDSPRGPLNYFGGVLQPVDRDEDGNVVYAYKEPSHKDPDEETPLWKL